MSKPCSAGNGCQFNRMCKNKCGDLSPYSINYKACIKADQRDLVAQRLIVTKLPRRQLEDKYLTLCDENFTIKRENNNNQEKIKRLATKLLRISVDTRIDRTRPREIFTPDENLEIRCCELEATNSQLKEKLEGIFRKYAATPRLFKGSSGSMTCRSAPIMKGQKSIEKIANLDDFMQVGCVKFVDEKPTEKNCSCGFHKENKDLENEKEKEKDEVRSVSEVEKLKTFLNEEISKNSDIGKQISELQDQLTALSLNKDISENIEIIDLKRHLQHHEDKIRELYEERVNEQNENKKAFEEEKVKTINLKGLLEVENKKNEELVKKMEDYENLKILIEKLEESLKQAELEMKTLKETNQKMFDEINNEVAIVEPVEDVSKISELNVENQELLKSIEEANSSIVSFKKLQEEMVEKIGKLENDNKVLSTQLEGTKSESEYVVGINKKLMDSIDNLQESEVEFKKRNKELMVKVEDLSSSLKKNSSSLEIVKMDAWSTEPEIHRNSFHIQLTESNGIIDKPLETNKLELSRKIIASSHRVSFEEKDVTSQSENEIIYDNSENHNLNSEDAYENFKTESEDLQQSELISLDKTKMPLEISSRLELLERAAFYPKFQEPAPGYSSRRGSTHEVAHECEKSKSAIENAKNLLMQEIFNTNQSKSRKYLKIQYNLNALLEKELKYVSHRACSIEDKLVMKIEKLKENLMIWENESRLRNLSNFKESSSEASSHKILNVPSGQGYFEFHVEKLKISNESKNFFLFNHSDEYPSLFLGWNFYNIKNASFTSIKSGQSFVFDYSSVYQIPINETFFDFLMNTSMEIQLYSNYKETSKIIGKADVNFADILLYPQNKIHTSVKIFSYENSRTSPPGSSRDSGRPYTSRKQHIGNLFVWFRLTCDLSIISNYKKAHNLSENELSTDSSLATNNYSRTVVNETKTVQESKDSSDESLVQSPIKKSRTEIRRKSSIEDESIVEAVKHIKPTQTQKHVRISVDEPLTQKEMILKRMSLFDAKNQSLSSGEETNSTLDSNEFAVKWAWKGATELAKKNIQNDKSISIPSDDLDENTETSNSFGLVSIEIISLQISDQDVLSNPEIKQLYIEYSFLGSKGHLLETPISLPKPENGKEKLNYNFRKTFEFDTIKDSGKQIADFIDMLREDSKTKIRFLIINEPKQFDGIKDSTLECKEVGFASLKLNKLVKDAGRNKKKIELSVYSTDYPHKKIGKLTVLVEGINFMQDCLHDSQVLV